MCVHIFGGGRTICVRNSLSCMGWTCSSFRSVLCICSREGLPGIRSSINAAKCFSVKAKQHRSLKFKKLFTQWRKTSVGRAERTDDVDDGAFCTIYMRVSVQRQCPESPFAASDCLPLRGSRAGYSHEVDVGVLGIGKTSLQHKMADRRYRKCVVL